jgi:hypothetical protein
MKRCPHCKTDKPESDFHANRDRPDGTLQAWCKPCKAEGMRALRASRTRQGRIRYWYPAYGEKSHKAKLRNEDVRLIRGLLPDLSCAEIARKFEVSRSTISAIKNNRYWTEVA